VIRVGCCLVLPLASVWLVCRTVDFFGPLVRTQHRQSEFAELFISFKDEDDLSHWEIGVTELRISRDFYQSFADSHSLRIDTDLAVRANDCVDEGTAQVVLARCPVRNRIAIVRVYVPDGAPTGLRAVLFCSATHPSLASAPGVMGLRPRVFRRVPGPHPRLVDIRH
jgi:hypothetical protein